MTMLSTDVHTHLAPLINEDSPGVEPEGGQLVIDGDRLDISGLYDPDSLNARLAAAGIDGAWVSAPPKLYRQGMDEDSTRSWVCTLDRGLRARVEQQDALCRLTYIPLEHPVVACELVESTSDAVGWCGAAGGGSLPLDDPRLNDLWVEIERSGKPLLLHPGVSPDNRLDSYYLSNLLGNPIETGLATAQLLFGGVLDRHTKLHVVLVHCGGIVPAVLGRWSRGVKTARPGVANGTTDPMLGVRRLWSDCLAHSPAVVDLAREVFGDDRLLLGSDYPFAMGLYDPYTSIEHLAAETRARIGANANSLVPEENSRG